MQISHFTVRVAPRRGVIVRVCVRSRGAETHLLYPMCPFRYVVLSAGTTGQLSHSGAMSLIRILRAADLASQTAMCWAIPGPSNSAPHTVQGTAVEGSAAARSRSVSDAGAKYCLLGVNSSACTCEERDYKGLHAFPSNITRDDPPITRDYTPSLLILQGATLQLQGIALPPF